MTVFYSVSEDDDLKTTNSKEGHIFIDVGIIITNITIPAAVSILWQGCRFGRGRQRGSGTHAYFSLQFHNVQWSKSMSFF